MQQQTVIEDQTVIEAGKDDFGIEAQVGFPMQVFGIEVLLNVFRYSEAQGQRSVPPTRWIPCTEKPSLVREGTIDYSKLSVSNRTAAVDATVRRSFQRVQSLR